MKKVINVTEVDNEGLEAFFNSLGFKVLSVAKKNENGPDVWVIKKGKPFSVEIKSARKTKRNSIQVPPVESKRKSDDFILINHTSGYRFFEKMEDHLKCCTKKGYRTLWS